jgi:hypothetical protein
MVDMTGAREIAMMLHCLQHDEWAVIFVSI